MKKKMSKNIGGKCPVGELDGREFSGWEFSKEEFDGWEFSGGNSPGEV